MKKYPLFFITIFLFIYIISFNKDLSFLSYNKTYVLNKFETNFYNYFLKFDNIYNYTKPFNVKGIYITGWLAGIDEVIDRFINLANLTEVNTFVIDFKDDSGLLSINTNIEIARDIKANLRKIRNIDQLIKKLKENNIYLIARIVCFKDSLMAINRPENALKYSLNDIIIISEIWSDPYLIENWQYIVEVSKLAFDLGFDEIQYDYVRFPAMGYGDMQVKERDDRNKEQVINQFLNYARHELKHYQKPISADVFGAITTIRNDLNIGQYLETISRNVDVISPMIYPTLYNEGFYGLYNPEKYPYQTVKNSIKDAKIRIGDHIHIRPWIQGFNGKTLKYSLYEIRQQINALESLGIKEWLIWNPLSEYSLENFLPNPIIFTLLRETNFLNDLKIKHM